LFIFLKHENVVVVVYGSMLYDDPVNLDFDLECFTDRENKKVKKEILFGNMQRDLTDRWTIGTEGHISYGSLERIELHLKKIKESNDYTGKNAWSIYGDFSRLSTLTTAYAGFTPNERLPDELRRKASRLIKEPFIGATVIKELQDTLSIREERRRR